MVPGPGPWSLVLVPGLWSLVQGPWSWPLAPGPWSWSLHGTWSWYWRSIRGTGFSPIGAICELWRYPDHHPTQNFDLHHFRRVLGQVEAILASTIGKSIEAVTSQIIKIRSNGVEMARHGLRFARMRRTTPRNPFQPLPGPRDPNKLEKFQIPGFPICFPPVTLLIWCVL